MVKIVLCCFIFLFAFCNKPSGFNEIKAIPGLWHNKARSIRYLPAPEGGSFVKINGNLRFNRALYGGNTAFRVETGDLPEFSMYMPGMGGNLRFGIQAGEDSKWLSEMEEIRTEYSPGCMRYMVFDTLLGKGSVILHVAALYEGEGMIVRVELEGIQKPLSFVAAYGGVSGERFSRNGDIGADPESSFYLKPENCLENEFTIDQNEFQAKYGRKSSYGERMISGVFPHTARLDLADAIYIENPATLLGSKAGDHPVLTASNSVRQDSVFYFLLLNPSSAPSFAYDELESLFEKTETSRLEVAGRIRVNTPDEYINTLGGALSIAADAIWEYPSYLHGAVAWRMRLPGWRGAASADPLGWHERAKAHFRGYMQAQYIEPPSGPNTPDSSRNWARQKEVPGVSLFTSGYVSRNPNQKSAPHHYDMNLVLFDQLLTHFNWTGDKDFVKEMWPYLKRHIEWEKRLFDGDKDFLYDAYACIWASDALQYSGGAVTHSSAYNYRINKLAAQCAALAGEDPEPYEREAAGILNALNETLWMPERGWFAEYKDLTASKRIHPSAGLWTVYHAIDAGAANPFQSWQMMNYVEHEIPHIPIKAEGLPDENYSVLSTTNWQPYTWSVNNVALAENLHTSLAFWQSGRRDDAFRLWKSALVESMYLSVCPGGFQQLSFYDAIRGELYRDFADPIGIAARSLVEGLFGVSPDLLNKRLTIKPGFPGDWEFASLQIPDLSIDYNKNGDSEQYLIIPRFPEKVELSALIPAKGASIKTLKVNGVDTEWKTVEENIGEPLILIKAAPADTFRIEAVWKGRPPAKPDFKRITAAGEDFAVSFGAASLIELYDPQAVFESPVTGDNQLTATIKGLNGLRTVFAKVKQGDMIWWTPLSFEVKEPIEIVFGENSGDNLQLQIINHTNRKITGDLSVNRVPAGSDLSVTGQGIHTVVIDRNFIVFGTNSFSFNWDEKSMSRSYADWNGHPPASRFEKVDISGIFNDKASNIFRNEYQSPRSPYPTLQLPLNGIGNWCYPNIAADIDDRGIRKMAGSQNEIALSQDIPFSTPGDDRDNIVFVSLWDNYPDSVSIPLRGKASHIYFLVAGSTNPMQSRIDNGEIRVNYADGTSETLWLRNPETWHPIEQDYYLDGYAFYMDAPRPLRLHLKTGWVGQDFQDYDTIPGFTNFAIEGGAATILDLPLDPEKELAAIVVKATANEAVIGLMSATVAYK